LRRLVAVAAAVCVTATVGGAVACREAPGPGGGSDGRGAGVADPALEVVARALPLPVEHRSPGVQSEAEVAERVITHQGVTRRFLEHPGLAGGFVWEVPSRSERVRFGFAVEFPDEDRGLVGQELHLRLTLDDEDGQVVWEQRRELGSSGLALEEVEVELPGGGGEAPPGTGARRLVFNSRPEPPGTSRSEASVLWANPMALAAPPPDRSPRPNVLILCIDTLRADRLLGDRAAETMPNLSARLATGRVYENAYANSSWSLPSMASIFTGRVPGAHHAGRRTHLGAGSVDVDYSARPTGGGIVLTIGGQRFRYQMLHQSVPTLQEVLGSAGYYTAAIHNNGYINYPTRVLKGADEATQYNRAEARVGTDLTLDWIRRHRRERFYLFLHFIDPHQWPVEIPEGLRGKSLADLTAEDRTTILGVYDRLVARTDEQVERVFEELESTGLLESTVVVLLADHGERFMEQGVVGSHGGSLRESVIRVPLVIWAPGLPPGRTGEPAGLDSVAGTVSALAGLPPPEGAAPSLIDSARRTRRAWNHDVIAEGVLWGPDRWAVVSDGWKYVETAGSEAALFALAKDPGEDEDLVERQPEVASRLRNLLQRHREASDLGYRLLDYEATALDAQTIESLRALGYID
jgi:arylsulfatase A-like enzyme